MIRVVVVVLVVIEFLVECSCIWNKLHHEREERARLEQRTTISIAKQQVPDTNNGRISRRKSGIVRRDTIVMQLLLVPL
jgi:hypothetical protein